MSYSIPFSCVIEGKRARDKKKYGNLELLAQSMRSVGTLHPIGLNKRPPANEQETILAHEGFVYELIYGGRRYATLKNVLQVRELWYGSTLNPERLGFLFADEVPEHKRKEAELDENLARLDMDWIDNCLLIEEVHEAKRTQAFASGEKWGLRQTGALLGGVAHASISYALRVAKLLRSGDKEIAACTNMADAVGLILKRNEDKAIALLQQKSNASTSAAVAAVTGNAPSTLSFLDSINTAVSAPSALPPRPNAAEALLQQALSEVQPLAAPHTGTSTPQPVREIPLSKMFLLGDCIELLPSFPDAAFDHIVTDIPYGIDMDNLTVKGLADVADQHEVELNVELMPKFLEQAFRLVRPGGFCVFFYDLNHHEKLQNWAADIGWRVQSWPYIACKTSACRNQAAQYNTTKNYEVAMYLRRDEKTVLRKPVPSSWKPYDFAAERAMYNNPFAKPFQLWKDIYDSIAFPGQSTLDPFCGEMSSSRAALNCGLVPFGTEISETHYNRGIEHMKTAYKTVNNNNVQFV